MQHKFRVLIVEDEVAIRSGLLDVFVYHGYDVDFAVDGTEGLRKANTGGYDLLLLDVMLPGIDGFEICNRIRSKDREQAIMMLTAKGADEDIIEGLTLGADDYVCKPFSVTELMLRVQAVLRRSRTTVEMLNTIRLGESIEVDSRNLSGRRGDEVLQFTLREIEVLQYLYANTERPVSRDELLNKVWGYAKGLDLETRTVDIHIAKLRRKLEPDPGEPRFITTVRGAGYRLLSD